MTNSIHFIFVCIPCVLHLPTSYLAHLTWSMGFLRYTSGTETLRNKIKTTEVITSPENTTYLAKQIWVDMVYACKKENIIEEQTKKYARCGRRNKKWLKGMQRDVFSSFSKLQ